MKFPDFIPAKRADVPNYVQAEIYQNALDQQAQRYNDEQRRDQMELPRELYNAYSDVTGTEPIADAIERNKINRLPSGMSQPSGPLNNDPSGTTSGYMNMPNGKTLPPGSPTTASPGVHSQPQAINPVPSKNFDLRTVGSGEGAGFNSAVPSTLAGKSPGEAGMSLATMPSKSNVISGGGADLAQSLVSNANVSGKIPPAVGSSMGVAAPIAGAFAAPALTAANGGDAGDMTKSTVASGASSVLAASWPGLAASGPGGWAAIAALSAASLYGMFA